jgi:hypothetical protein
MDLAAALTYWGAIDHPIGHLHVRNLTAALHGASAATWSPVHTVSAMTNTGQRWRVYNEVAEEQPVAQANAMVAALQAASIQVTPRIMAGTQHAYDYWSVVVSEIATAILAL